VVITDEGTSDAAMAKSFFFLPVFSLGVLSFESVEV
jgi:hypothetical protein